MAEPVLDVKILGGDFLKGLDAECTANRIGGAVVTANNVFHVILRQDVITPPAF